VGSIEHNGENILTQVEARRLLHCSASTLHHLIRQGKLEPRKVPGHRAYFVTLASVVDVLCARKLLKDMSVPDVAGAIQELEARLRVVEYKTRRRPGPERAHDPVVAPAAVKRIHPEFFS
jgi:hypothetical protein